MSETVTEKKKSTASKVGHFTVEASDPRLGDVVIQSIPGCRLRSAVKHVKELFNPRGPGKDVITGKSNIISGIPELPGMQLIIKPGLCRVKITDPLHGDEETCALIKSLKDYATGNKKDGKLDGVPPREEKLDPSRMKTLVREVLYMIENGTVKMVGGSIPEMEDIEKLPGNFLLNPGSRIQNLQPRFEKDFEGWVENLDRVGG